MAQLETKPTTANASDFLERGGRRRASEACFTVVTIMQKATGANPKRCGASIPLGR